MKMTDLTIILVPIDFSKLSRPAIAMATGLARRFEASIHLVHVHEPYYPPGLLAPVLISVTDYWHDDATRRIRRLQKLAKQKGLAPENCHFLSGSPAFREICNLAREIKAGLIVMPTHGRTGMARLVDGSTAERIVQHSPCPVLVARAGGKQWARDVTQAAPDINQILVPVDFSQSSFQALQYAIRIAEQVASRLIIFHAFELGDAFTADGFAMYDLSVLEDAMRKDAEEQMQKFVSLAKFRRVPFETVVTVAPAVSEICAYAGKRDVDLIITATHGRTGLKHLLMGSVAEHVVRHATRPVLVVPSHRDLRINTLTNITVKAARSRTVRNRRNLSPPSKTPTKRERKLLAHAFPERRKTNRFRESHSNSSNSRQ